jgi:hypothetical protein
VCYNVNDPVPDLVINADKLKSEIIFESKTFDEASCAVYEKCVEGMGERRLMRFTVEVINQGLAALTAPPPGTNPQLFQWSPCHGHFHFTKFAEYYLLSSDGTVVKSGRKQAYCMLDSHMILEGPNVPCKGKFRICENFFSLNEIFMNCFQVLILAPNKESALVGPMSIAMTWTVSGWM